MKSRKLNFFTVFGVCCGIMCLFSFIVLVPVVQDFFIDIGGRVAGHPLLDKSKWIKRMTDTGISSAFVFFVIFCRCIPVVRRKCISGFRTVADGLNKLFRVILCNGRIVDRMLAGKNFVFYMLVVLFGAAIFCGIYGVRILNPRYTDWLLCGGGICHSIIWGGYHSETQIGFFQSA